MLWSATASSRVGGRASGRASHTFSARAASWSVSTRSRRTTRRIEHFAEEADRAVAGASAVHIQLDAAIFEDGALAGDDRDGWISALFGNDVRAKQEWYRGIRLALADGGSADDAFAPIREFQMDFQRRMQGGQVRDLLRDPLHVPRVQAAAEAQSWRRRVGDQRIAEAAQALRLEPFVIVRRP